MKRGTPSMNFKDVKSAKDVLADLQSEIGLSPPLQIESFTNWGRTQNAKVISCHPTSQDDIRRLIKAAKNQNIRVRCAGSCHSWAPVFSDDNQLLLYMDNIKSDYQDGSRIRISNAMEREVDIMTGVTTGEFKEFQLKYKLNITANAILDVVHMVSVVTTGCHGVGRDQKTPSDHIVKMRIFDSDGYLRTYDKSDEDMLKAVSANFGCFGVIFDMTIKLEPEIIVSTENKYCKMKDLFKNADTIKALVEDNWSVEAFWFPFNSYRLTGYTADDDSIWVRVINKLEETQGVELQKQCDYAKQAMKDLLSQEALEIAAPLITKEPAVMPLYALAAFKVLKTIIYPEGTIYQELPHAIHFRKFLHKAPVYDMEFAFDIKDDYKMLLDIIGVVREKVDSYAKKDEYPLNVAMEMRWMGYSNSFLCPAVIGNKKNEGSGHMFYIEILSLVGTKKWKEFRNEVGQKWMELGGVPHLAKEWEGLPGIENHIYDKMGQHIDKF